MYIQQPREAKKVCTVTASSTTNAPKSVLLPWLMCNIWQACAWIQPESN